MTVDIQRKFQVPLILVFPIELFRQAEVFSARKLEDNGVLQLFYSRDVTCNHSIVVMLNAMVIMQ